MVKNQQREASARAKEQAARAKDAAMFNKVQAEEEAEEKKAKLKKATAAMQSLASGYVSYIAEDSIFTIEDHPSLYQQQPKRQHVPQACQAPWRRTQKTVSSPLALASVKDRSSGHRPTGRTPRQRTST